MEPVTQKISLNVILSTTISMFTILAFAWLFIKPQISTAVADEIKEDLRADVADIVDAKLKPLTTGFQALIEGNIAALRQDIARMEFRRDRDRDYQWTDDDEVVLSDLKAKMLAQIEVLSELRKSLNENTRKR